MEKVGLEWICDLLDLGMLRVCLNFRWDVFGAQELLLIVYRLVDS